ncbi:MAG: nicotinate-nucleotide--dimethylbenzimidazole phosphoribosyltransferase [Rhodobacteraceae bacterium]|nr:nicotinate-nucleotide--dimethylbenzimidazole phosphoribosyltransferase [Paracoccaceae bacterium]
MVETDTPFCDPEGFRRVLQNLPAPDESTRILASERNALLTKPSGSLGRLEELAIWYASWRGDSKPEILNPQVIVFAGNHGVAAQGVSAYPPEVTAEMIANFNSGGAAINQLARQLGTEPDVHAIDIDRPTGDISCGAAMTETEFTQALLAGWRAVRPAADLVVPGEMGIGNTTSAAALALALYGGSATDWTGAGTGVDGSALERKVCAVASAVEHNGPFAPGEGLDALRRLGGRELAAIAGAIVCARIHRIPVVLDGFICTAAASALHSEVKDSLAHAIAGHCSAEAGHGRILEKIGKRSVLDLEMRLGEGSGAAVAALVLKAALACHSGMSTFEEAQVSGAVG